MKAWKVFHTNDKGELFPATPAGQASLEVGRNLRQYRVGVKYVSQNPFFCFSNPHEASLWAQDHYARPPYVIREVEAGGKFYDGAALMWGTVAAADIRRYGKSHVKVMLKDVLLFRVLNEKNLKNRYKFACTEMTVKGKI